MTKTLHTDTQVQPNGDFSVSMNAADLAGKHVHIVMILEPVGGNGVAAQNPNGYTDSDWKDFIRRTAGAWQGGELERPDQGEYEVRDPLE